MKLVSSSQGYRDESLGETGIGPEPREGVTPGGSSTGLSEYFPLMLFTL